MTNKMKDIQEFISNLRRKPHLSQAVRQWDNHRVPLCPGIAPPSAKPVGSTISSSYADNSIK